MLKNIGKGKSFSLNVPDKESLSEQIANELRQLIAKGEISPGTHIKEVEIAESLSISRAPVREAISLLISEHILEKRPYKGVFVYMPTKEDRIDLLDARFLIESYSIDKLVISHNPSSMSKLQDIIEKIKEEICSKSCDWRYLMDLDLEFHEILCNGCENRFLIDTWKQLILKQRIIFMMDCADGSRINIIADEHIRIFDSICARDSISAKALMRTHILNTIGWVNRDNP